MLELFFKHLDFVAIEGDRSHEACEKNLYKFNDANINKHWRSFYATYRNGYVDACNKFGVLAVQKIGK